MAFANHMITSSNRTLKAMVTAQANTTNTNLLTEVIDQSFRIHQTLTIRKEKTMDGFHMFQIPTGEEEYGKERTHQMNHFQYDKTDNDKARIHTPQE